MPEDAVNQSVESEATPQEQTVKRNPTLPEISALQQYREREASSANAQGKATDGQPAVEGEQQREQYIPRDRFDQVNEQKNQYQQQVQQMQAMLQQFMMQQQQHQASTPAQHPGGMVNPAVEQQQQAGPKLPDFNDPEVAKEWQNKIANGGVKELVQLMQQVVEATGAPLLQQFQQQIQQQLTPLQRSILSQTADRYAQQRSQSDPAFQQVRPYFEKYLEEAVTRNPGIQLNEATLSTIEHVARLQAQQVSQQYGGMGMGGFNPQLGFQQPNYQAPQSNPPFTERPGAASNLGQQKTSVTLTPQQRAAARGFGMTDEQYAARLREMNIV